MLDYVLRTPPIHMFQQPLKYNSIERSWLERREGVITSDINGDANEGAKVARTTDNKWGQGKVQRAEPSQNF